MVQNHGSKGGTILWKWKVLKIRNFEQNLYSSSSTTTQPAKITSPAVNILLYNPMGRLILEKPIKPYDSINFAQFFEFGLESLYVNNTINTGNFYNKFILRELFPLRFPDMYK